MRITTEKHGFRVKAGVRVCALVASSLIMGCATTVVPDGTSKLEPLLAQAPPGEDSPNAKTLYSMARLLILRDRLDRGEVLLVRLVNEYPRFVPAYCDLAELRLQQGLLKEAVAILEKGLEIAPQEHVLINNLGVCHLMACDYELALEKFQTAATLRPQESRYRANMALAYGLLGNETQALEHYKATLGSVDAQHNVNLIERLAPAKSMGE